MARTQTQSRALSLLEFKNRIRGSRKPRATLSSLRDRLSVDDYAAAAEWLKRIVQNSGPLFPGKYPRRLADLRSVPILGPIGASREIAWAAAFLSREAEPITTFLSRARDYEGSLLSGRYDECLEQLEFIEQEFGSSLWVIESRIALIQVSQGLEQQKSYTAKVREGRAKSDFASFLAFYLSQRNEPTTNPDTYTSELASQLDKSQTTSALRAYVLYRLADLRPIDPQNVSSVLRYEGTSAVVDYYDTFLRLGSASVCGSPSSLTTFFTAAFKTLHDRIPDPRIGKFLFLATGQSGYLASARVRNLDIPDAAASDRHLAAISASQVLLQTDPSDLSSWLALSEAHTEAGSDLPPIAGLGAHIASLTRLSMSPRDGIDEPVNNLRRLAFNFRLSTFAPILGQWVADNLCNTPFPHQEPARRALLEGLYLEPLSMLGLTQASHKAAYAQAVLQAYGPTPHIREAIALSGNLDLLPNSEGMVHLGAAVEAESEIIRALNAHSPGDALESARTLRSRCGRRYQLRGIRYEAACLLELGRTEEAVDFVVGLCIKDATLAIILPLAACAERLDKAYRKSFAAKLSTPILLDLYSRYVDDRLENLRSYAYEDFLLAEGLERPSELKDRLAHFGQASITYYLRKVCVPNIMQISTAFSGTTDLEDERVAVCSMLIQIDHRNAEDYESEIREITRRQIIQRGVRHVEQSKVFVNLPYIRRWADRNLKENFARYQSLLKAGMKADNSGFIDAMQDLLSGKPLAEDSLKLPENEASALLVSMLYAILDKCTLDPEHGLDCYLSMRIRHGALSGQLRGPLEDEHVITQRTSDSVDYKPNEYWLPRLSHLSWNVHEAVSERLSQFSSEYDGFVNTMANSLIQVKDTDKNDGLFTVGCRDVQLGVLAAAVKEETSFESFVEMCAGIFWEHLETCLRDVRDAIDTGLKVELNRLFVTVQADIEKITDGDAVDLCQAVRTAQTGAQQALDHAKEWFRLAKPASEPDFYLEDLIDIGLQCVKRVHHDFDPIVVRDVPLSLPKFASAVTLFSDMFFIVFDNVWRHSGVSRHPRVNITVHNLSGQLQLLIVNELNKGARTPDAEAEGARIGRLIADGGYRSAMRSEGGSGLSKLRKIIGQGPGKELAFGFDGDDKFYVQVAMPTKEVWL